MKPDEVDFLADVVTSPGLKPSTPRERQIARELAGYGLVAIDHHGCVFARGDATGSILVHLAAAVRKR